MLVAVAVGWDGRRSVLGVELANRESRSSWRDFLLGLKERGLHGVEFVVADDHAGLRAALREALSEAAYQRCYVHTIRTQSTVRIVGRSVSAGRWAVQWDDMTDLQAAVVDDDALDDELQEDLLIGKARLLKSATDPVAKSSQIVQHRPCLDLLSA